MSKIDEQKQVFFNNLYEFCIVLLQSLKLSVSSQKEFIEFLDQLEINDSRIILIEKMKRKVSSATKDDESTYQKALAFLKFTKQQWGNLEKDKKDIVLN